MSPKPRAMTLDAGRPTDAPVTPVAPVVAEQAPPPVDDPPPPVDDAPPADEADDRRDGLAADAADDAVDEDTGPGWADDTVVQAARLAMRSYAKHRDATPRKAEYAAAAIATLRAMGGNDEQVASVFADARVKPRELAPSRPRTGRRPGGGNA